MIHGVDLTDEQRAIHELARDFAARRVAPDAAKRDKTGRFPADLIPQLGALGLLGIKVPDVDGGAGCDMTSYVLAISEISKACASTGVTMAVCNLAADIMSRHGTPEQKRHWLLPYLAGKLGAGTFA
ncbi:MAG TPA: acyl-CoA dehydrogenase family protein, partial [Myxococcota bacterium]